MTGATSGLGKISAMLAASKGATLVALARNKAKGQKLLEDYKTKFPKGLGRIEIVEGNLSSFESIVSACKQVLSQYLVIDMLVNNAGIMNFERTETQDNIEETLQVNLLSPLLLCHLLFDSLNKSKNAKIIFTSSGLHQGEINFDNLEFVANFTSFEVYRQSKLGVILACRVLSKRLKKHNISIYSQHPGMVRTELGKRAGWISRMIFYLMGKSPEKGSQTLSSLMEEANEKLVSGEYYSDRQVTTTTPQSYDLAIGVKLLDEVDTYIGKYVDPNSPLSEKEA